MIKLSSHQGFRFGNFRPFAGIRLTEDGAAAGFQAGITTYGTNDDGQETYQTSYVEVGGRSDHLEDLSAHLKGDEVKERLVSDTAEYDVVYVGDAEENAKAAARAAKRAERKDARKAKKADKKVAVVKPTDASPSTEDAVAA